MNDIDMIIRVIILFMVGIILILEVLIWGLTTTYDRKIKELEKELIKEKENETKS